MLLPSTNSPVIGSPLTDGATRSMKQEGMREEPWQRDDTTALFFADTAFIGIIAGHPGPRFCWILNQHLRTSFANIPSDTIHMIVTKKGKKVTKKKKVKVSLPSLFMPVADEVADSENKEEKKEYFFPVYCHNVPDSSFRYLLYKLRSGTTSLLYADKNHRYDYLMLVQTAYPQHDTHMILEVMRGIPEVQLAQELASADIERSKENLVL